MGYPITGRNLAALNALKEKGGAEKNFAISASRNGIARAIQDYGREYEKHFEQGMMDCENKFAYEALTADQDGRYTVETNVQIGEITTPIFWEEGDIKGIEFKKGAIIIHGPEKGDILELTPRKFTVKRGMLAL